MRYEIDIPEYHTKESLKLEWDYDFKISTKLDSSGSIHIKANQSGLISLARHLLLLAQKEVPSGYHIHLDISNSLEDDSIALILERE